MRGRSYTPSPPRGYGRRGRSPSPRGRYRDRGRDMPTSLLVRNLRHDCRPEDLRRPFGQFGALKDIYLPRDYYTGEPRGFGFVQFVDPADAAEAKYHMDGYVLLGRELTVVFAEENRKKPTEMRQRDRGRSPPRRRRSRSYGHESYSPSPKRRYTRSPPPPERSSTPLSPPPKRRYTRSPSPHEKMHSRERSCTPPSLSINHSRSRSRSPVHTRERSYTPPSPTINGSRSRSQTPVRGKSQN
ncbi:hypothetical protein SAY86_003031 [Trapa natans]|uniref:RRM domain-containing protein n=1 Tax=Trapa natans TaxID=22666 RepID=A0AAN7LGQ0_TRANT|nr:hypothetical protein SAY86_003031 [Trapa natans]